LFALWAGFELVDLIHPLGHEGLMPLYLGIAAVTVYLAVEGWRHAALPWQVMSPPSAEAPAAQAGHDWAALGARWEEQLRAQGAYRESDLRSPVPHGSSVPTPPISRERATRGWG
jgi:hypothetical protein